MERNLFRAPSVGGVVNKVLAINDNLTSQEVIEIIRKSVQPSSQAQDDFGPIEVINEKKALELARASVKAKN